MEVSQLRPPFETFTGLICKGCYALGNECGTCEKCKWETQMGLNRKLLVEADEQVYSPMVHAQRFDIGGTAGRLTPDGGPYITGTGKPQPSLRVSRIGVNYNLAFDGPVQTFRTDREGLKAIIADLVALL